MPNKTHNQNPNLPRTQGSLDATRARELVAFPGQRPQSILTPAYILDRLRQVWGRISLDPAAPPEGLPSLVEAEHEIRLPEDGLAYTWSDRTFVNPPYKHLKQWLQHEYILPEARVAWLVPLRSHRKWWLQWAQTQDTIIALQGVKFHGYDAVFPAPVGLAYQGKDHEQVATAFADIGVATKWG